MEGRKVAFNYLVGLLFLAFLGVFACSPIRGQIFVVDSPTGVVGAYHLDGTPINVSLISGLNAPTGIVVSGSTLFIADTNTSTGNYQIGEYTITGSVINSSLITLPANANPYDLALSGTTLFVANQNNTIGAYTTTGATINDSLITGVMAQGLAVTGTTLFNTNLYSTGVSEYTTSGTLVNASFTPGSFSLTVAPRGLTVSGTNLFIAVSEYPNQGWIEEYTLSGTAVNTSLISDLSNPFHIASLGTDLFVTQQNGTVGEYTMSGTVVNSALISGLSSPWGIAVQAESIPEPSTWSLLLPVLLALGFLHEPVRKNLALNNKVPTRKNNRLPFLNFFRS